MQTLADFELSSYGALHKFSAVTSEKIASAIGDAWVLPAANKDMSMPISPWDGLCARAASSRYIAGLEVRPVHCRRPVQLTVLHESPGDGAERAAARQLTAPMG